jgi:hypothetical protein
MMIQQHEDKVLAHTRKMTAKRFARSSLRPVVKAAPPKSWEEIKATKFSFFPKDGRSQPSDLRKQINKILSVINIRKV